MFMISEMEELDQVVTKVSFSSFVLFKFILFILRWGGAEEGQREQDRIPSSLGAECRARLGA